MAEQGYVLREAMTADDVCSDACRCEEGLNSGQG